MSERASAPGTRSSSEHLALVGGTLYPSPTAEPVRDGVVLVQNGKIVAAGRRGSIVIPDAAHELDCSGCTLAAGFWNSHVHFFERKWAQAASLPAHELDRQLQDMLTRYGFTSVFDTGSPWDNTRALRDRVECGDVPGPRIRSTGEALLAKGAAPPEIVLRLMGLMNFPAPEIADAEEATAAARELLDRGVDGIKLHLQAPPSPRPPFPDSAMVAAAREAHLARRPVFAHPNTGADVLAALRADVDVIAHTTPGSGPWDEAIFAAMKERRVALTPTLTLWKTFLRHDRASVQAGMVDAAVEQLRAWIGSGGTVLFGTDLGVVDYEPSDEYALMAEAGMSFPQILSSLTQTPTEFFGVSERLGRIAAGFEADLVVLKGDPSVDVRALAAVRYTLRGGKVIYRAIE